MPTERIRRALRKLDELRRRRTRRPAPHEASGEDRLTSLETPEQVAPRRDRWEPIERDSSASDAEGQFGLTLAETTQVFFEGRTARERGDLRKAQTLLSRALEARLALTPEDDPWVAPMRNELGLALKEEGRLEEARALFERAHAYFKSHHDERHPDYATTLNNLGATLLQQGEHALGEEHLRRALEVQERHRATGPGDFSNTCWILGAWLARHGNASEGRTLLERALARRAEAGESSGKSVAGVWRDLATALAVDRRQLQAMRARRFAVSAYSDVPEGRLDALHEPPSREEARAALARAEVEFRLELLQESEVIDLAVQLAQTGGPLEGDDAVTALACLDERFAAESAQVPQMLRAAVAEIERDGILTFDPLALVQAVFDFEVQLFIEDHGSPRRLIDRVDLIEAELVGWQPWLEYFRPDGETRTSRAFSDDDPEDIEWLLSACKSYLDDRSAARDPEAAERIGATMTARASRRRALLEQRENADRAETLLQEGRRAHEAGRPGAEATLRRAVELFERSAPDTDRAAVARNQLGLVLKEKGRLEEAASLFRRAHRHFATEGGLVHPDTAITMHNLGATLSQMGDVDEGGRLIEHALELQLRHGKTSAVDIANTYSVLGDNLRARRELPRAFVAYEEALRRRERLLDANDRAIADTCINLSDVASTLGDYETAERYARRVIEVRNEALGFFHRDTADALNHLATVLERLNRLDEAEQALREALGRFQDEGGHADPLAINARINLADVLQKRGRHIEAEQVAGHALALCEQYLGPSHKYTARALELYGAVLSRLGRAHDALPILTRARSLHESIYGRNHLKTAYCLHSLGLAFLDCGAADEAETMFTRARAAFSRELGPDHNDAMLAEYYLGSVLHRRGETDSAARVWTRITEAETPHGLETRSSVGYAAFRLGEVREWENDLSGAEACFRRALAVFDAEGERGSREAGVACGALGRVLCRQDRAHEAEPFLDRAYRIARDYEGLVSQGALDALHRLIDVVGRRDPSRALTLLADARSEAERLSPVPQRAIARLDAVRGRVLRASGELDAADRDLSSALERHLRAGPGSLRHALQTTLELADLRMQLDRPHEALDLLRQALVGCDDSDEFLEPWVAALSVRTASIQYRHGQRAEAARAVRRAWAYYSRAAAAPASAAWCYTLYRRIHQSMVAGEPIGSGKRTPSETEPGLRVLRLAFSRESVEHLSAIVQELLGWPYVALDLDSVSLERAVFCETADRALLFAETRTIRSGPLADRLLSEDIPLDPASPYSGIELSGSNLALFREVGMGTTMMCVQDDLVKALAEYPWVEWEGWVLSNISGARKRVDAQGSDARSVLGLYQ